MRSEARVGRGTRESHLNRLSAWGVEEDGAKEEGCSCKTLAKVGYVGFVLVHVRFAWGASIAEEGTVGLVSGLSVE